MGIIIRICLTRAIIFFSLLCLASCKHHQSAHEQINPEILGTWSSSDGCKIELQLSNKQLFLRQFVQNNNIKLNNLHLSWTKKSVFTLFYSTQNESQFMARFSDGLILIDGNRLCNQALHKADTN